LISENLPNNWHNLLYSEISAEYFKLLLNFLENEYRHSKTIYPPKNYIFKAFELCPFEVLKVVIIGQDPYHGPGQAHGLSFSVNDGVKLPPSLKNIFIELKSDLGTEIPFSGNLSHWAEQGVLLLNAILTVEAGKPGSHRMKGWEKFTDAVISVISKEKEHVVFLLWGNYAIEKSTLIDENKHLVLKAAHPSPLARGAFFGSKHFSKANAYLTSHGLKPINW
jgi:uracil-DNA glycosylase